MAKKASAKKKSGGSSAKSKAVRKVAKKAAKKPNASADGKAGKAAPKKASGKGRATRATRASVRSPLSKAELREFRQLLLAKRRDLLGDMSGIEAGALRRDRSNAGGDLSTLPTHPADVGSDNFEQEFTLGLLESERALLKEIDEALLRIEDGTYGVCLATGVPIGKPRLTARPWAKYCIEYARQIEKGLVNPEEDERRNESRAGEEEDEESSEEESGEAYEYEDEPYGAEDDED